MSARRAWLFGARTARCGLAGCALWTLTACTHVKPYEREYLAKHPMNPTTDPYTQSFEAHLRESREGATSSASAGGGGCGCN